MGNKVMKFTYINNEIKIKKVNDDIYFKLEDIARSLGFIKIEDKNGKMYSSIRLDRVRHHLETFDQKWSKVKSSDYISEEAVYLLAMKANNKIAIEFQIWLATEVLPSIRKYGAYIAPTSVKDIVDKLNKFSKFRIKRTFSSLDINEFEDTFNDFLSFAKTIKAKDRIVAYRSALSGLKELLDRVYGTKEKSMVLNTIKDLSLIKQSTQNRINAATKRSLIKEVKHLQHKFFEHSLLLNSYSINKSNIEDEEIEFEDVYYGY